MYCKNCGLWNGAEATKCSRCSNPLHPSSGTTTAVAPAVSTPVATETLPAETPLKKKWYGGAAGIGRIIFLLAILGSSFYYSLDDKAVETNNQAITNYESGNTDAAIKQFQEAANSAVTTDAKISTLKNLGYAQATSGLKTESISSFKKALELSDTNSFDYYLIKGEIASLEGNGKDANDNYNRAYNMKPNDFQINNAMTLFYLDLGQDTPEYIDYESALMHAKKAHEVNPMELTRQNLALAYFFNEEYDQTIAILSSTNMNNHPEMYVWVGMSYIGKNDTVNAKLYIQKAMDAGVELPPEIYDYMNNN